MHDTNSSFQYNQNMVPNDQGTCTWLTVVYIIDLVTWNAPVLGTIKANAEIMPDTYTIIPCTQRHTGNGKLFMK